MIGLLATRKQVGKTNFQFLWSCLFLYIFLYILYHRSDVKKTGDKVDRLLLYKKKRLMLLN